MRTLFLRKHCLFLWLSILSTSLFAEEGNEQLFKILKSNGHITEQQYQNLLDNEYSNSVDEPQADYIVDNKQGLEISSMDGENHVKFGASLGFDWTSYSKDKNDLGSGTEIRRSKLSLSGLQNGIWNYKFTLDISPSDVEIDDAFINNTDDFPLSWTIGQFKQPFGLESISLAKHHIFMERSLMNELAPKRSVGMGIQYVMVDWNFALGLFGDEYDSDADDEGDEGWSVSSRIVYVPVVLDGHILHVGFSLSQQSTDDDNKVRFHTRPESHLTDLKLFDTGKIKKATNFNRVGFEFAWSQNQWLFQTEWIQLNLERESKKELVFSGGYMQFSYFLTGESHHYSINKARFSQVKPLRSGPAIELAYRLTILDLDDKDIDGGKGKQMTLAVNWYFTDSVKLMLNYSRLDYENTADAAGDAVGGDQGHLWQARLQMGF